MKIMEVMNSIPKGKPVFYNDFDGNFGMVEEMGGEPYVLIPQWEPERLVNPPYERDALHWLFLGYTGQTIEAIDALKVLCLQYENCMEKYWQSMCRVRERLETYFERSNEQFTVTLVVEATGEDEVSIAVRHDIYGQEEEMCKIEHFELTDDCGLDFWTGCMTKNVEALFPLATTKVVSIEH